MLRLHAHRTVATMKNMQPVRNRADKQFMTDPVGVGAAIGPTVDPAVARYLAAAPPVPTAISRWGLGHCPLKSFNKRKPRWGAHWEGRFNKNVGLRISELLHESTVSPKTAMVNE